MKEREDIIHNYVNAYNNFDIDGMVKDLDDNVRFENISSGETNMVLDGISSFKEQAEQTKAFFSERKQTITSFKHEADETEIEIDYHAVLACDFPNGLKKGDVLQLQGRSVFNFKDKDHKITAIKDIS